MKSIIQMIELGMAALLAGCAMARTDSPSKTPAPPPHPPGRATAIGGVFFKCKDPAAMRAWYGQHLGLQTDAYGTNFEWRQADDGVQKGFTQWGPFPQDTKYFEPSVKDFMINYRVVNLEALIEQLKKEGVTVVDPIEVFAYGKFCHVIDPEGNKIELWEPNDVEYDKIVQGRTK